MREHAQTTSHSCGGVSQRARARARERERERERESRLTEQDASFWGCRAAALIGAQNKISLLGVALQLP